MDAGLSKDFFFEPEDIFKVNLEKFTKVYCYLDEKSLEILKPKLEEFVKSGGGVYSYEHKVKGVEKEKKILLRNNKPLYIYKGK
ncbi:MAG: hypothetical protein XD87_0335 [candidate division WS6 bacterium 36_33]|uniref:Uncharacterized protein n=1 Tax=candidate division WS6 bacterium 36_33 TaxID=1641388 RepID=A0A101GZ43_9BACT|nr:MAG: hypothetical protein XD87_0335 [candidate division WS6 bacterium 36_33]